MTEHRPTAGLDSPLFLAAQGVWADADIGRGHLRAQTLINVRWMVIAGEALLLAVIGLGLGHSAPFGLAAGLVALAVGANVATASARRRNPLLGEREALAQLLFDVTQIAVLLALIGGTGNPFVILLLAPVILAAATLSLRPLLVIGNLAALMVLLLAFVSLPYPNDHIASLRAFYAPDHEDPQLTLEYRVTLAAAVIMAMALTAGIVRQSVVESARMALALDVARTVMAREQRLASLGLMAAATAHELGTPLSTISVIARELSRAPPDASVREDAELLIAEAARCREILGRLGETPERGADPEFDRVPLRQLLQEVVDQQKTVRTDVRITVEIAGAPEVGLTLLTRSPEVGQAMSTLVENAAGFARSEVRLIGRLDAAELVLEVHDDGPGFSPEVFSRLGEPYVTSRPRGVVPEGAHVGLGLGFFIAKTLLERMGAVVTYRNDRPSGAVVVARWQRRSVTRA